MTSNPSMILSRQAQQFIGWVAIDEFENLLSRLGGWQIVSPSTRRPLPRLLDRVRSKITGDFGSVQVPISGGDLLLVVARTPGNLQMVDSIAKARKQFRFIAGYVIDSFFTDGFGPATKHFDHIFSTTEEGAEAIRHRFGVSSSVLRQGFDCLNWSSVGDNRCIDIIGFGRQPSSYHRAFQAAFHQQNSPLLYLHSPIGTVSGTGVSQERPMMLKLLQRSKLSLAFHLDVEPHRVRPKASGFVTSRWFESLASGCIVVGKRPLGAMTEEMFCWPDATIELPDDPSDACEVVQKLVSNSRLLSTMRARNVYEMCRRHDWRYRIRDIYQHFGLQLPRPLRSELETLEQLTKNFQTDSLTAASN